jgi:AcrR family transcriptional regulator
VKSPASPAIEERDGRRRRSHDSRARIVQAMLELVQASEVAPSAEQVAARADVGLRTVFRHFKDMDSLYGEMAGVVEGELHAIIDEPLKGRDWREQVVDLVGRRAAVYETIAPFKHASQAHRHRSPFLESQHLRLVRRAREILKDVLPAEIVQDDVRFEGLDLLLSFETWSRLRRDQRLSPERAAEVVAALVRAVMEPPAGR